MSLLTIALLAALPTTNVLTLAEAEETALASQPQLRSAQAQVDMAEARTESATSPLYPQISFDASYSRSTSNNTTRSRLLNPQTGEEIPRPAHSFTSYDFFNFGLTARQLIYDFGQTTSRRKAARESAASQIETQRAIRLDVLNGVRLAFLNARAQKELVRVAEQTLTNQARHYEQIQAFVEVKIRPEIDLAQARLDLANARVQLVTAENGYATAKAQLNQAMGVEAPFEYEVGEATIPAVRGEEAEVDALVEAALTNRPEIASLRHQKEAQRFAIRSAEGGYGPSLSASLSTTMAGPSPDNLAPNWSAGLLLNWPLFQGYSTSASVREARASLVVTEAQADALRQQIRLDIARAQLNLRAAKAALEAADDALTAAEERLALAEARYASGVGNIIELGDAQLARTAAAAQLVQAEYALASARITLRQALGTP